MREYTFLILHIELEEWETQYEQENQFFVFDDKHYNDVIRMWAGYS